MPEGVEIELYRRATDSAIGRRIESVDAPDAFFVKGGASPVVVETDLVGRTVTGTDRVGKVLLVELNGEPAALGLRFGMTGRLVVDGHAAIDQLEYSSGRDDPAWDRFSLKFADGGSLRVNDPRRLGGVELAPDLSAFGVDLFDATPARLRAALGASKVALKTRLLDQRRIAGVGNLIADETLWRAGLDPVRPAGSLSDTEIRRLSATLRRTANALLAAGGSHLGRLQPARVRGGLCPRDGAPLDRRTIGGRTSYSCPVHQV
ncbi:MAG: DNA-formamidopyrimidine glycosylase family protein [Acidimicrobiales bacterium]